MRVGCRPDETDAPLIVDPDTVLAFAFAFQRLQPVGRRNAEIIQLVGIVQHTQFSPGDGLNVPWEPARDFAFPYLLGLPVPEARDYGNIYNAMRYITSSVIGWACFG